VTRGVYIDIRIDFPPRSHRPKLPPAELARRKADRAKRWRHTNPGRAAELARKYRSEDPEKSRAAVKACYRRHRDKRLAAAKARHRRLKQCS
jgi:hypothetical protein